MEINLVVRAILGVHVESFSSELLLEASTNVKRSWHYGRRANMVLAQLSFVRVFFLFLGGTKGYWPHGGSVLFLVQQLDARDLLRSRYAVCATL